MKTSQLKGSFVKVFAIKNCNKQTEIYSKRKKIAKQIKLSILKNFQNS